MPQVSIQSFHKRRKQREVFEDIESLNGIFLFLENIPQAYHLRIFLLCILHCHLQKELSCIFLFVTNHYYRSPTHTCHWQMVEPTLDTKRNWLFTNLSKHIGFSGEEHTISLVDPSKRLWDATYQLRQEARGHQPSRAQRSLRGPLTYIYANTVWWKQSIHLLQQQFRLGINGNRSPQDTIRMSDVFKYLRFYVATHQEMKSQQIAHL